MTETAANWRATPRANPFDTGEFFTGPLRRRLWFRRHPWLSAGLVLVGLTAATIALLWVFVIQMFDVLSPSMAPSLDVSDRIVINRLDTSAERGDIVVYEAPGGDGLFVRRVVATEGETVSISDGSVMIDGAVLRESYLGPSVINEDFEAYVVPEGMVFLLGDNRQDSYDSRLTGAVDEDRIIGTMVWQY